MPRKMDPNDPLTLTDMRDMKNQKLSFNASSISLMVVPVAFKPSRLSRENAHRSAMVSNTIIETGYMIRVLSPFTNNSVATKIPDFADTARMVMSFMRSMPLK